jgi:DNA repair exonuclease SbcCD nuclease subunit
MNERRGKAVIRFIHAADLHLDRPFDGLSDLPGALHERVKESTFKALDRLIDKALAQAVDFLIIAGDVFDDSHRSLIAQRRFIRAMNRLAEASIPAFIAFGNHDHLDDPWNRLAFPGNVHVFPASPSMIPYIKPSGERVHLYGFSYLSRHVKEDMTQGYRRQEGADYHIGVLHGALGSGEASDLYAPFSIAELTALGFDYWALGHIHKRQQLSPPLPIWYPGDIQGLSIKETGRKGALLVELDSGGAGTDFFQTDAIRWEKRIVKPAAGSGAEEAERLAEAEKEAVRGDKDGVFLRLDYVFAENGQSIERLRGLVGELTDALNEDEASRDDFVWLLPGRLTVRPDWDKQKMLESPHFIGDVFRLIEKDETVRHALSPLLDGRMGRRYLGMPGEAELRRIRNEAEQLIAEGLLGDKED